MATTSNTIINVDTRANLINYVTSKPIMYCLEDRQTYGWNGNVPEIVDTINNLYGDILGNSKANRLARINGRPISMPKLPASIGDDFNSLGFNENGQWNVVNNGGGFAITQNLGLAHFGVISGQAFFLKSTATFDFNDKYIIFDFPNFNDGLNNVRFGICDQNRTYNDLTNGLYQGVNLGSQNAVSDLSAMVGYNNSVNPVIQIEAGVVPRYIRLRTETESGKFYIDVAGSDGVFINKIEFPVGLITNKVLFVSAVAKSNVTGTIDFNNISSSLITGIDDVVDKSLLNWNALKGQIEPSPLSNLVPTGDVNLVANTVKKVQGVDFKKLPETIFFEDDFTAVNVNYARWQKLTTNGDYSIVNGQLVLTSPNGGGAQALASFNSVNANNKTIQAELVQIIGAASSNIFGYLTSGYDFSILATDTALSCFYNNGVVFSIPYDAVAHRWLRLRHDAIANKGYYDVSPDGENWTNLFEKINFNASVSLAVTNFRLQCNATQAGTQIWDNVTSDIVLTPSVSDKSLYWYDAAENKFVNVSLANLKVALNALP